MRNETDGKEPDYGLTPLPLYGPTGPNRYVFCVNSPVGKTDALGLYPLDYPSNWGEVGPMPAHRGAYGLIYEPKPDWFMNPKDAGRPCCCESGPVKVRVSREDYVAVFGIAMVLEVHITGCYKDFVVTWDTCWRYPGLPWGDQISGGFPNAINSLISYFNAYAGPYQTHANIRYLACEGGKWKRHLVIAGRRYNRYFWGISPVWGWDDLTSYN